LILQLEQVLTVISHATKNIHAAGVRQFRYEANHYNLETAQRQL
jgi:hypothetical protein